MSIKVVLFDLDGTLLPMDQGVFTKTYFGLLAQKLAPIGYDPKGLVDAIWSGTAAMVKNGGVKTNEEVFWDKFAEIYGDKARKDIIYFEEYYQQDFDKVKASCGFNSMSKEVVDKLKERGIRLALATNPIFPAIATQKRIRWAGLKPEDFEIYTTYENSRHCKPNPEYYRDILKTLNVKPEECLMVGNDVAEDMVAETVGMKVFLLSDCLINKEHKDISKYPRGDFYKLMEFIEKC
ncbi:MAG: HAD family hydrolase [Clostridiales bacterium]|nr:HAD family hydrolase [Clostridiales bacterium]